MSGASSAAQREPEPSEEPGVLASVNVREALNLPAGRAHDIRYTEVSTDTRTLQPGALFVALKGERHDGADHLEEAARAGAAGAVVPRGREVPGLGLEYFLVTDPLRALGALGAWRRRHAGARVVGITGSSGKTTVKEMVAAALSARRVFATPGNLNSRIGLPLTILRAPADAEVWVLELGASEPGEIETLTQIADPDDAVVTTVGPAHLEFFGSLEGVMREKLSLVRGARRSGSVMVGELPPELPVEARRLRRDAVVAGLGETADFRPDRHGLEPERIWFERRGVRFQVEAGGMHHLRDALLASAVAEALGVPAEEAAEGLAGFRPLGMRSQIRRFNALTVLADCYNANPESFQAAIDYLTGSFPDRRLAAAVGSMLELGDIAPEAHRRVLARLVQAGFDPIAATGQFAAAAAELEAAGDVERGRLLAAVDAEEAAEPFEAALRGDEVVLLKASRGARLERILYHLEERYSTLPPRSSASAESVADGGTGVSPSEGPAPSPRSSASGASTADSGSEASPSEGPAPSGAVPERGEASDPESPEETS